MNKQILNVPAIPRTVPSVLPASQPTVLMPIIAQLNVTDSHGAFDGTVHYSGMVDLTYRYSNDDAKFGEYIDATAATKATIVTLLNQVRSDPANSGKSEHDIANQAHTAVIEARNGFYGLNDEFIFLKGKDSVLLSNVDHFLHTYANGTGSSALENPLTGFVVGTALDILYNACKAVVQALGHECLPTGKAAQSPANWDFWAFPGAWAAIQGRPYGQAPDKVAPVAPVLKKDSTSIFLESVTKDSLIKFDPLLATGYDFKVLSGGEFSAICVPASSVPGVGSFMLGAGTLSYIVKADNCLKFDAPVSEFHISGINGSGVGLSDFVFQLAFSDSGVEVFAVTELSDIGNPNGVPEARSAAYFVLALILLTAIRRFTLNASVRFE